MLNYDVYVNVVGGMKPDSTSTDLGVALAVYSSATSKISKTKTFALGEVGLTGDLRSIRNGDKIIQEAQRLGYERVIIPNGSYKSDGKDIEIVKVKSINEAIKEYFK